MNLIAPTIAGVLSTPLRAVRGILDLPAALERNARETRDLIEASYLRLEGMYAESTRLAGAQVAELQAEIARLNEQLARIGELVEPRAQQRSERLGAFFRRTPREA